MKINNKGFAFSTMLYGVLTMIILVLMLIFGLMKYYKDENDYYSLGLEETLNDCVFEEVALENCYTSSNDCDPTVYYACMGINANDTNTESPFASVLKSKVVTTGNGLYVDDYVANRYVYRGAAVDNYIMYSGLKWRIVSLEIDGTLKLIFPGYADKMSWDEDGNDDWKSSSLNNHLENSFYPTLTDTSRLVQRNAWKAGWVYESYYKLVTGNCSDTSDVIQSTALSCEEKSVMYIGSTGREGVVGLLNVSDYFYAASEDACRTDAFGEHNCSSWLSSYSTWLINPYGDATSTLTTKKAYYIDTTTSKIDSEDVKSQKNVLPTVYLDSMIYVSGSGTADDPYIVK